MKFKADIRFIIISIIIFFYTIKASFAAQLVAKAETPVEQQSVGSILWNTIKWPLLIVIILVVVAFIVVRIVVMILSWIKHQNNTMHEMIGMKMKLSRSQMRSGYPDHFFKWRRNAKIYLFYKDKDHNIKKESFGAYMGDFLDTDNVRWIAFSNKPVHFLLPFIPKYEVIMCPQSDIIKVTKLEDIRSNKYTQSNMKIVPIRTHFLQGEVLIETDSVDRVSPDFDLYLPVITDDKGSAIDSSVAIYELSEHLILKKAQYDVLNGYAQNLRKALEMNVIMKGKEKMMDQDGQVSS